MKMGKILRMMKLLKQWNKRIWTKLNLCGGVSGKILNLSNDIPVIDIQGGSSILAIVEV